MFRNKNLRKLSIFLAILVFFAGASFLVVNNFALADDGGDVGGGGTGDGGAGGGDGDPMPSCSISVSPSTVNSGQSVTISWSSDNANYGSISGIGTVSANGSQTINPISSMTYSGTFYGVSSTATCSANVTVIPVTPKPTCSMTVSPSTVSYGSPVVLSWSSTNATSANIAGLGAKSPNGSATVYPDSTGYYSGTFTGAGGTVNCSVNIYVTQPTPKPTCSMTVSPSTVSYGSPVVLSWSSTNATSANIAGLGAKSPNGSATVYPDSTGYYSGTFTGAGGTVSCTANITVTQVNPQPTCAISADKVSISKGESFTLSWSSTNATSASITSIGSVSANGSRTLSPTVTTTYTGTFTGAGGTVTCSKSITVKESSTQPLPTCAMNVSPSTIDVGGSSTLSWSSSNTSSVVIDKIGTVSNYYGSRTISPIVTTTYTGTFTGAGGSVTCSATLYVNKPVVLPTCTLNASPKTINQGESSTLSWTSTNAAVVYFNNGITNNNVNGSLTVSPTQTTTYEAVFSTCDGICGELVTCTETITVIPPTGNTPTCSMTITPQSVNNGEPATLTWTTTNVVSGNISPSIGNVGPNGSTNLNTVVTYSGGVPLALGNMYTGTFLGTDGSTVNCEAQLLIKIPPTAPTCTMTASPSSIASGGSSTLTWTTTNVVTSSNQGSSFIDHGIGPVEANGSRVVTPSTNTTYTGTFYGTDGSMITCSAPVTIISSPAPSCTLTANPSSINQGGSSVLTLTTQNVTSVSLTPYFHVIAGSLTAQGGSVTVAPTVNTIYTVNVSGPYGTSSCSAPVTIGSVNNTPSCQLSINPTAVVKGGSATLTWSSQNVTSGNIDNGVGSVSTGGSMSITPSDATTYTGSFTGPNGSVTCSASISVSTKCLVNCGGGGNDQPNVTLNGKPFTIEHEPSYVYLSQVPYTGFIEKIINGVKFIFVEVPTFIMVHVQ